MKNREIIHKVAELLQSLDMDEDENAAFILLGQHGTATADKAGEILCALGGDAANVAHMLYMFARTQSAEAIPTMIFALRRHAEDLDLKHILPLLDAVLYSFRAKPAPVSSLILPNRLHEN